MKAVGLSGPWAVLEQKRLEAEAKNVALAQELDSWRQSTQTVRESLAKSEAELLILKNNEVPRLQQENERAKLLLASMQVELDETKATASSENEALQSELAASKKEMDRLTADNTLLKQELAKAVQVRSATHNKIEEARKKLGLSPSEAQVFIREFDETTRVNTQLRKDLQLLQTDRNHLAQQCEQRSSHCMTLIAENKRLVDQISQLRQQVVSSEADAWRLRQQLSAAAQRDQHLAARKEQASQHNSQRPAFTVRPSSAAPPPPSKPQQQPLGSKGKENTPTNAKTVPSRASFSQKPPPPSIVSADLINRRGSREPEIIKHSRQPSPSPSPSPSSSCSSSPLPSHPPPKQETTAAPLPKSTVDPDPFNLQILQEAMQMRHSRHLMLLRAQDEGQQGN